MHAPPPSTALLRIRVFLASPGDVSDERALALRVLERLPYDPFLRGKIAVETVAWDKPGIDTPMLATLTPQEAIYQQRPKPSECDIVVVVFWSRMGTPLPPEYVKPDGGAYLSGTEWEYLDAPSASLQTGRPKVLVYHRTEEPRFGADDPSIGEKLQQRQLGKDFFASFRNRDGSIRRAVNNYDTPDAFEKKLTEHLREIVQKQLAEHEAKGQPQAQTPNGTATEREAPQGPALERRNRQVRTEAGRLETDPGALAELTGLILQGRPAWSELLLFIDQFEELFTVVAEKHRGTFSTLLARGAELPRLRILVTLRADFYHRCLEHTALEEPLRAGSYPLAAPGVGALYEMITRPAARAGLIFEDALPERILDDADGEPGALPLMAFALQQLYEERTAEGELTHAAYERFGEVKGAISRRAEDTYSGLDDAAQATLAAVFRELIEVDSTEEGWVATRRRAPLHEAAPTQRAQRLVAAFTEARLLQQSDGESGVPVVEVAHEALLRSWPRLVHWIQETGEDLAVLRQLQQAAKEWKAQERRGDLRWPRRRWKQAERVIERLPGEGSRRAGPVLPGGKSPGHQAADRGARWGVGRPCPGGLARSVHLHDRRGQLQMFGQRPVGAGALRVRDTGLSGAENGLDPTRGAQVSADLSDGVRGRGPERSWRREAGPRGGILPALRHRQVRGDFRGVWGFRPLFWGNRAFVHPAGHGQLRRLPDYEGNRGNRRGNASGGNFSRQRLRSA